MPKTDLDLTIRQAALEADFDAIYALRQHPLEPTEQIPSAQEFRDS